MAKIILKVCPANKMITEMTAPAGVSKPNPAAMELKASATATVAKPTANNLIYETTSLNVLIKFKAKSPNPGPIAFSGLIFGF